MDPNPAALRQRLARASRVPAFAEAAGDPGAVRIAGTVLADLLAQAGERGIEPGPNTAPAEIPGPQATHRPA
jgi:hypothetical protein